MAGTKVSKNRSKAEANGAAEPELTVDEDTLMFASTTLRGDIRDALLAEFRSLAVAWKFMNEAEQERLIHRCRDIADGLVRRAVLIASGAGSPHLSADIAQIVIKDALKIVLTSSGTTESIVKLAEHHGPAVLVLIDPQKFMGQRKAAQTDVVGDLKMPRQPPEAPGVHAPPQAELPGIDTSEQPAA